jgi:Protein of unknown function (DUF2380).
MLRQALERFKSVVLVLLGYACIASAGAQPKALALADFELIDEMREFTSEAARRDDERRIALASAELRKELERRALYRIQPEGPRIARCWVQKVSNLILNLNIEVRDAATDQVVYRTSVDIRGNTDESWLRGVRRLVDNIEARKDYLR